MDSQDLLTFIFGAGSAGTVVGSLMLWRIKKSWENLDKVPVLVDKLEDVEEAIDELNDVVHGFSGELRALERAMHVNQKDIAVTDQKVQAAFRHIDSINRDAKM